jgi:hypothetical protein
VLLYSAFRAREFGDKYVYRTVELTEKYGKLIGGPPGRNERCHDRHVDPLNPLVMMEEIAIRSKASHVGCHRRSNHYE